MKYYAMIGDRQAGPAELPELTEAGLTPETYVWCKGMDDWTQAKDVADICRYFRQRLFDKMHPGTAALPAASPQPEQRDYATPEEMRHMKRREYWQEVSRQIAENQPDPQEELSTPPSTWWPFPIVLAIIAFSPLGIPAAIMARRSAKQWQAGNAAASHESARMAKMCAGMAFAAAMMLIAVVLRAI